MDVHSDTVVLSELENDLKVTLGVTVQTFRIDATNKIGS
jgi:hypothetical protein